jgi:phosphatidylglycerol:prolipoprotein diacylglycerol transferase
VIYMHPQFNPTALQLGPVAIHWYGLMYVVALLAFVLLGRYRLARRADLQQWLTVTDLDDLMFYGALGIVLGGRLGYVLFYKFDYYREHLGEIFAVWQGGMSFHGGLLGVLLVIALFARHKKVPFLQLGDFIAPLVPIGLAAGRLGNFINGELWGRPTDGTWGMIFPQAGDFLARHPSQLYQCAGEGVLLFVMLWLYSAQPRAIGRISGLFLIGYGVLRFLAEFARQPDAFLGTLQLGMTMGQWLCLPMLLCGAVIWVRAKS